MAQARRVKEGPGLDLGPVQLLFCCILSRNILRAGPNDLARQSGISWAAVMARDAGGDAEAGGMEAQVPEKLAGPGHSL